MRRIIVGEPREGTIGTRSERIRSSCEWCGTGHSTVHRSRARRVLGPSRRRSTRDRTGGTSYILEATLAAAAASTTTGTTSRWPVDDAARRAGFARRTVPAELS